MQSGVNRIDYIDRFKGLLILWVIWYHTTHPSWADGYFHVPLFMIVSGVFMRLTPRFGSFFRKKVKQLLVPFLFFYLFGFLYNLLHHILMGNVAEFLSFRLLYVWLLPEPLPFNIPIWFIIALFYISLLLYPLMRWVKSPLVGFGIPMLCSYLYNVYCSHIILPLHGFHVIVWFPFVVFGYYFGRSTLDWVERKCLSLIVCVVCVLAYVLLCFLETDFTPFGVFIFYLRIFLLWGALLPLFRYVFVGKSFDFLGFFGKNTLILLGVQSMFLNFMIQWVRPAFNLPSTVWIGALEVVFTAILSLPMIYLLNRFFPYFVGRNFPDCGSIRFARSINLLNTKKYGNTRV